MIKEWLLGTILFCITTGSYGQDSCAIHIAFKGGFIQSDTVIVESSKRTHKYIITFDSFSSYRHKAIGYANFLCLPTRTTRIRIIFEDQNIKIRILPYHKEIIVVKGNGKIRVMKKRRIRGYL